MQKWDGIKTLYLTHPHQKGKTKRKHQTPTRGATWSTPCLAKESNGSLADRIVCLNLDSILNHHSVLRFDLIWFDEFIYGIERWCRVSSRGWVRCVGGHMDRVLVKFCQFNYARIMTYSRTFSAAKTRWAPITRLGVSDGFDCLHVHDQLHI